VDSRLEEVANRALTPDEFQAYVNQPISPDEREGVLDLVRWFTTRYSTPLERLAYVRRTMARWGKTRPG